MNPSVVRSHGAERLPLSKLKHLLGGSPTLITLPLLSKVPAAGMNGVEGGDL